MAIRVLRAIMPTNQEEYRFRGDKALTQELLSNMIEATQEKKMVSIKMKIRDSIRAEEEGHNKMDIMIRTDKDIKIIEVPKVKGMSIMTMVLKNTIRTNIKNHIMKIIEIHLLEDKGSITTIIIGKGHLLKIKITEMVHQLKGEALKIK